MAFQSSYRQCFVSNTGTLLADGQTVDALAVGQIGILDGKTHKAVSVPTYAKNKAIKAVWGTPDLNVGEFGGVPNENEYRVKCDHCGNFVGYQGISDGLGNNFCSSECQNNYKLYTC